MPVSTALLRLLRVRELLEDEARRVLEATLAELTQLENALVASGERARRGRQLIVTSARCGELADSVAGLEEVRSATCHSERLSARIATSKSLEFDARRSLQSARIERRQVETLIEETKRHDAQEEARRAQRQLDDGYLIRGRAEVGQEVDVS